nr:MAG TPA: hypothetical protein [Caudoviricetes sp.]
MYCLPLFHGLHLPRSLHAPCKPFLQTLLDMAHTVRLYYRHQRYTAYYHSWLITNEMYDADFILIIMTLTLYACAFVQMICRSFRHK